MKIGVAAATSFEIEPTLKYLMDHTGSLNHDFEILVTGVGSIASTYQLGRFIKAKTPGLMIQAGIAGSFNSSILPGETVIVADEVVTDLGVWENNLFRDMFELGFLEPDGKPFNAGRLVNPRRAGLEKMGLPLVHGATVNEISTSQARINLIKLKYGCEVESMEGAAFHYVCIQEDIPFLQLRSVSNFVGERDKSKWKIRESIENLNKALIDIIQQLT